MPKQKSDSVGKEILKGLQLRGVTSPMLEARLQFAESNHLLTQYIRPMAGETRVHPNMHSPQASGRLSVSDPPLINFTASKKYGPHGIRDVVIPDAGWEWASGDLEAVEARIIGLACGDKVDQEAFDRNLDIHTVTGIRMMRWPDPPFEPTKKNLFSDVGAEWCDRVAHLIDERDAVGKLVPYDDGCKHRRLFKNCRYCLQYAKDARAMFRYAVEMRMEKKELELFGNLYLQSKPWLVRWKLHTWADCWRTHEARTAFGRRRRLAGRRNDVEKEGLNHIIQGTVADMMKQIIRSVCHATGCGLAYQSHDGFKFIYPVGQTPLDQLKPLVGRTWTMWGKPITIPASWEIIAA